MKIISEIDNGQYFRGRAIELINLSNDETVADDCLKKAITLLVMARINHEQERLQRSLKEDSDSNNDSGK